MSTFDDAANAINQMASGKNQAISDQAAIPVASALLAIAEAINGLTAAIKEERA
jgi:hypothetical protein